MRLPHLVVKPLIWAVFAMLVGQAPIALAGVQIQHWVAPSGARVYFVETRVLPIVDLQVDFAAGGAFDPKGKKGLASVTRSLMDAGAGGLDEEAIAGRLVDTGARMGGSTDLDRAGFSLRTLSTKPEREAAIDLLRRVLQSPDFPAAILEREKARIVASIKEADTRPDSIAAKRFSAEVFGDHPYGPSATVESVSALAREDLVGFHRDYYAASRAVVSIIGDLSRGEAEEIAQQLTAGLPKDGAGSIRLPDPATPERKLVRIAHPAAQSHIYIGMPGLRRGDPDYFPLIVGNYILGGGGFVSRLTQEVREKRGFAYSVYSYFLPLRVEGAFQIGLQTKREQADEALEVVDGTLRAFLEKGPTDDELKRAKRNLIDGFALRLDSNRKILEHLAVIGFYGLPLDYLDDYPKRVAQVTASQIRQAFARRVRPENLVTVVVGGPAS